MLEEFRTEVQATLAELRTLAHGIYPPLLRDRGLGRRCATPRARGAAGRGVEVQLEERPPAEIEAAVYFCCLEAMNNAVKHAGDDASITLSVRVEGTSLTFDVIDSGVGFEMGHSAAGQGFDNMSDRLGAYGGELDRRVRTRSRHECSRPGADRSATHA